MISLGMIFRYFGSYPWLGTQRHTSCCCDAAAYRPRTADSNSVTTVNVPALPFPFVAIAMFLRSSRNYAKCSACQYNELQRTGDYSDLATSKQALPPLERDAISPPCRLCLPRLAGNDGAPRVRTRAARL